MLVEAVRHTATEDILRLYSEGAFRFEYRYNPRYEHEWYDGRDAHQFTAVCHGAHVRLTSYQVLIEEDRPYSLRELPMAGDFGAVYGALLVKHAAAIAANDARGREPAPQAPTDNTKNYARASRMRL